MPRLPRPDRDKTSVMTIRSGAVSLASACGIALLALAIASAYAPARAAATESADLALCDRVAADPADPDKPAEFAGVATITPSDVQTAIKYCKRAAPVSRRALYELGRAYAANQQMPDAVAAWRKAADKGSSSAMVELGALLGTGSGVPKDVAQAHDLFERAAQAGNSRGVINLVALADDGGPSVDPVWARATLVKAAETNSAEAEFQLGLMYANGTGGPKDDVAARALFDRAAAQNHPGALEWAGSFAESGRGGPKDETAAKTDYEKAVALGNDNAKAGLRRMRCSIQLSDKKGNPLWTLCTN
jgi:TPR repeat protein